MTIFIVLVPPFLSTLQWGMFNLNSQASVQVSLPISLTESSAICLAGDGGSGVYPVSAGLWNLNTLVAYQNADNRALGTIIGNYLVIGR